MWQIEGRGLDALAHSGERVAAEEVEGRRGALTAHTSDVKTVAAELASFRPTLVLAVPRVFEKFANTARRTAAAGRARLFRAAENTAGEYSRALDRGRVSPWLGARRWLWDRLVYRRLRAAFGGRLAWAMCGGAPLSGRLGHFLRGIGVPVLEGYGLTEATAGVTLNLPAAQRIGPVGRPVPGCTARISADGEVLVSGDLVFGGYWHNVHETQAVLDDGGWLCTGDLGELDAEGFLTITGRKKDVIVTASGKNVAPAVLEDTVRQRWLVDQCVVVGDRRPYVAALVTVDRDGLAEWKREHYIALDATVADLRDHPQLLAAIQVVVDEANGAVSHAEAIKRFRLVPADFLVGVELTPTEKVRRDYVVTTFGGEIDALYAEPV